MPWTPELALTLSAVDAAHLQPKMLASASLLFSAWPPAGRAVREYGPVYGLRWRTPGRRWSMSSTRSDNCGRNSSHRDYGQGRSSRRSSLSRHICQPLRGSKRRHGRTCVRILLRAYARLAPRLVGSIAALARTDWCASSRLNLPWLTPNGQFKGLTGYAVGDHRFPCHVVRTRRPGLRESPRSRATLRPTDPECRQDATGCLTRCLAPVAVPCTTRGI